MVTQRTPTWLTVLSLRLGHLGQPRRGSYVKVLTAPDPVNQVVGLSSAHPTERVPRSDTFVSDPSAQDGERELGGFRFPLGPLHHQPDLLVVDGVDAVVLRNLHPAKTEGRGQRSVSSLAPRGAPSP